MIEGDDAKLNSIAEAVIGCAYRVHDTLGHGFLERVYENAQVHELRKNETACIKQRLFVVVYDGVDIGEYVADLIAAERVLVEIKAIAAIDNAHVAPCLNYLAVTQLPLCLLLNFGQRVEVRRFRGHG